jgi:hypothetical protein
MHKDSKIVGYGICGPGEADRYLDATLKEFKRLCDETIILLNRAGEKEINLIQQYGFKTVIDDREWGKLQWKIKQDFVENHVSKLNPTWCVCLDMDEVFDSHLTKEWILNAPFDAYHVFIVDLWNDGYKPESCFWNVRLWKWNGKTKWKQKPVHCGLAPEWTYHYHRFAPFILKHYGLMRLEDRQKKIKRYEKYDPKAEHLDRKFYTMLQDNTSKPFNEELLHNHIAQEVASYNQSKPKPMQQKKERKFVYVRNPAGYVLDIPEEHLTETLSRPGFTYIGTAADLNKELEDLFAPVEETEVTEPTPTDSLVCNTCGFIAKSALGLGAHKRKHA